MPYTPPSQRSPAASGPTTPSSNLPGSSGNKQALNAQPSTKHSLPNSSSSYLNRHRRSPSLTKPTAAFSVGPDDDKDDILRDSLEGDRAKPKGSASKPADAHETPPTSSPSDDDDNIDRGRARDPHLLKELQAAMLLIEQRRESSPAKVTEERIKARATLGLGPPRLDPLAKEHAARPGLAAPLPLSDAARKISHSRSSTDVCTLLDIPRHDIDTPTRSASESDLDEYDDDPKRTRPTPVRKKSGELVKPALSKNGSRRRPLSVPGTPTYSKAVHFDAISLENVRTFCGSDRPIVVSAGTSPAEQYSSDIEFPFGDDPAKKRSQAYTWDIRLSNFPSDTPERMLAPVRVERIYLSTDNKTLMGSIAVANLAFHKTVVARFTLDYWKTTSEVVADYTNDVRRKQIGDGYDRFVFSIRLEDQANLESKIMFFCVRYNVNGQEYWDNNNSINYQVNFAKKPKDTKQGTQGTSLPLPRSQTSRSSSSTRPRSLSALDDFGSFEFPSAKPPPNQVIGDSPIRFKNQKPAQEMVADAPVQRSSPSSQAFAHRYNFGVSLHNAIASASPGLGERGDPNYKASEASAAPQKMPFAQQPIVDSGRVSALKATSHGGSNDQQHVHSGYASEVKAKPAALAAEKPSPNSKAYQELLNTYCFYGANKSGQKPQPTAPAKIQPPPQSDGASDEPLSPKAAPVPVPVKTQPKAQPTARTGSPEIKTPPRVTSPRLSRSPTPTSGSKPSSRPTSPVFGYSYPQPMENALFGDSHTPTAIRGQ
ncbi:MAG: hypothetical protein Q9219_003978 [cf. Caloplaca sp. 3 TL-2023]